MKNKQPEIKRPIPKTKVFKIDWVGQVNFTAKGLKHFLKEKFKNKEMIHKIEVREIKKEED